MCIVQYPMMYKEELKTGTEDTLERVRGVLEEGDILTTNIPYLEMNMLQYYFSDNEVKSIKNLWESNVNKTIWYFENIDEEIDKTSIESMGYEIQKVYSGDFDGKYYFNLYKVDRVK